MALQRLKLIVVENGKVTTTEFTSYKALADYAESVSDGTELPAEENLPIQTPTDEPEEKKFLQNELQIEVQERKEELGVEEMPSEETPSVKTDTEETESDIQFLQNEVKDAVEKKKKGTTKQSFWDKLK